MITTILLGDPFAHPAPAQGCYVCAAGGPTLEQFLDRATLWAQTYGLNALRLIPLPRDPMTDLHAAIERLVAACPGIQVHLVLGGTFDDNRAVNAASVADLGRRVWTALGDLASRIAYVEVCNEPTYHWTPDLLGMMRYHADAIGFLRAAGFHQPILFCPAGDSLRAAANGLWLYNAIDWHSYTVWPDPDPDSIRRMPHSLRSLNDVNVASENRLTGDHFRVHAINAGPEPVHGLVVRLGGQTFTFSNPSDSPYLNELITLPAPVTTDCVLSDTMNGYWLDITVCRVPASGNVTPADYFRWLPNDWLLTALAGDKAAASIEQFTSGSFAQEAWGRPAPTPVIVGESGLVGQVNPTGLTAAMTHAAKLAMLAHLPIEALIWNGLPTVDETPIAVAFSMCARVLTAGHLCRLTYDHPSLSGLYVLASNTGIVIVNLGPACVIRIPGVPVTAVEWLYPPDGIADNAWTMSGTDHVRSESPCGEFFEIAPMGLTLLETIAP